MEIAKHHSLREYILHKAQIDLKRKIHTHKHTQNFLNVFISYGKNYGMFALFYLLKLYIFIKQNALI